MDWTLEVVGAYEAIRPKCDLDLYLAPAFGEAALEVISYGKRRLLIDMAGVEYLDSTGVGAIIRIILRMTREGGRVAFVGLRPTPRRVLEMSNVISVMRIFAEEKLAAEWLGSAA
jgi:anti-anti-sigma factor